AGGRQARRWRHGGGSSCALPGSGRGTEKTGSADLVQVDKGACGWGSGAIRLALQRGTAGVEQGRSAPEQLYAEEAQKGERHQQRSPGLARLSRRGAAACACRERKGKIHLIGSGIVVAEA